ncbi:hypothetical protein BJY52DRAFT_1205036 [Lactarius psammicola]|nr:hypothetical protein BJY52DRAFT_1205036 [Lactarius psammicola]
MGKPERAAAAHLLSFFPDIPLTIDDYLARRSAAQDARWPHVQLLPGVEPLVAHLATHGVPIAIATSSVRRNYERQTAHLQHVFARFGGHVVCGDYGVVRGKPFPDVFLVAARPVVWIPDKNLLIVGRSQTVEQPDQTLRSLEYFVPEEWGLPPFTTTEQSETKV